MDLYKQFTFISLLLVGASASMVLPMGISWLEQQQRISADWSINETSITPQATVESPTVAQEPAEGNPRAISVPSLGLETTVEDGTYDAATAQWLITEDAAFFATMTNPINSTEGNTFIYGHNSDKIFGKLPLIEVGATVTVTTDNGYRFEYKFVSSETVLPTDVHVLEYTGTPRLTLQTCTGLWAQNRDMFYFDLVSYSKI